MGRPSKQAQEGLTVIDSDGNPVDVPVVFESDEPDPIVKAAQELGASGDQGRVEIWRVKRTLAGPQEAYVSALSLEDFSIQEVQRRFGGGEFRIKIRTERGRIYKQDTKTIEGEPITPKAAPAAPAIIQSHEPRGEGQDTLMRALGAIMEQNNALLTEIRNSRQQMPQQKTMAEMANELLIFKQLFDSGPRPDPFAMFTQTIGLIKETGLMGGGGGEGGGSTTEMDLFGKLIDKFGPALLSGLQKDGAIPDQSQMMLPGMAPVHNMAPQPIPPQMPPMQNPAPRNPPTPASDPDMMKLRMALGFLCQKAAENSDPELYADLVLDNASDEEINGLFSSPTWIEQLASVYPNVKNHTAWFAKLKVAIESRLTEDAGVSDPSAEETPPE